jgi:regulator of ribonuclease activity B
MSPKNPLDRETLDAMKAQGADLSKPTEMSFYLYFPAEDDAENAAAELRRSGYAAEVRPPLPDFDEWLCYVTREMVPSATGIDDARSKLESVANRFGGDFDGWEAAIRR